MRKVAREDSAGETSVEAGHRGPQDIGDYLRIFKTRFVTIAIVAYIVVIAAFTASVRQTPVYISKASVLVGPPTHDKAQAPEMATEKRLAGSSPVAATATGRLGLGTPPQRVAQGLSLSVPVDTSILVFGYSDRQPQEAQRRAQAFAEAFIEYRGQQLSDRNSASVRAIEAQLDSVEAARRDALARATQANGARGGSPANDPEVVSLDRETASLRDQLSSLRSESVVAGQIVDAASLPGSAAQPKTTQNVIVAMVLGLLLGLTAALLRDRLDDSIRGATDLEVQLSAPVLGVVGAWPRYARTGVEDAPTRGSAGEASTPVLHDSLVTLTGADPRVSEAFRRLGTNLLLATKRASARSVLVTSCREEETRTFTTANLAIVLASMGVSTIVVSANVRNRRLDQLFHMGSEVGLTDVLLEEASVSDALWGAGVDQLLILPTGGNHPLPSAGLGPMSMAELIRKLETMAEIVLVDSVPLLSGFADAAVLATACDVTLLVVDTASSARSTISEAHREISQLSNRLIGCVLIDGSRRIRRRLPVLR